MDPFVSLVAAKPTPSACSPPPPDQSIARKATGSTTGPDRRSFGGRQGRRPAASMPISHALGNFGRARSTRAAEKHAHASVRRTVTPSKLPRGKGYAALPTS
ncbi:hypothetical protein GCM10010221_36490 [Streptomyces parvus]|nr:hypothetical protein GCM10010221_36490 [Streptomyces parvus]